MSKITLSPDALGTGTFTIAAPDSNTDRTLTLPDADGIFDRLNRAGNIRQVVSGFTSTEVNSSSSAMADTGLSATITPTSTSSAILVLISHPACFKSEGNGANALGVKLFRGATELMNLPFMGYTGQATQNYFSVQMIYRDAPSSTSALTYKTQFNSAFSTSLTTVQKGNTISTITLIEVIV